MNNTLQLESNKMSNLITGISPQNMQILTNLESIMRLKGRHFLRMALEECPKIDSEATKRSYETSLRLFFMVDRVEDINIIQFRSVTIEDIQAFIERNMNNARQTILNRFAGLATIYDHLTVFNLNKFDITVLKENNPFKLGKKLVPKSKKKITKKEEKHLTIDQIKKVMRYIEFTGKVENKLLVSLGVTGGFRRSEFRNVQLKDIFENKGEYYIALGQEFQTKGKEIAYVNIPLDVMETLVVYLKSTSRTLKSEGFLFMPKNTTKDGRIGENTLYKRWKAILKECKFEQDYCLHSLRHTFVTFQIESGKSIDAVQKIVRHKNYQTTMDIYNHSGESLESLKTSKLSDLLS